MTSPRKVGWLRCFTPPNKERCRDNENMDWCGYADYTSNCCTRIGANGPRIDADDAGATGFAANPAYATRPDAATARLRSARAGAAEPKAAGSHVE